VQAQGYADSLLQAGQHARAALAFERQVYQGGTPVQVAQALLKKAWCQKQIGQFEQAYTTAGRANLFELPDSLAYAMRYEQALNAYLGGQYELAHTTLLQLNYYTQDTTLANNTLALQILTLGRMRRWNHARPIMHRYNTLFNAGLNVDSIYAFAQKRPLKNPDKAENLATFLPGTGQWYAGYPLKGITSAALQAGSLGFFFWQVLNGYYFIGGFTGVGLFYAFYTGGIRHTMQLVKATNSKLTNKYNQGIQSLLLPLEQKRLQGRQQGR